MPASTGQPAPDARHRHPEGTRGSRATGATRAPSGAHQAPAPLGDRRGLTASGALLLQLLLTAVGALLDAIVGQRQLWLLFTIGFVLSAGLTAQRVHREDLGTSVLLPPIVYAVIVTLVVLVAPHRGSSGFRQHALDATSAMILHAPILLGGTLLAAVVALRRGALYRRHPGAGRGQNQGGGARTAERIAPSGRAGSPREARTEGARRPR